MWRSSIPYQAPLPSVSLAWHQSAALLAASTGPEAAGPGAVAAARCRISERVCYCLPAGTQVQEQLGLHSQAAQRRAGPASPLKAGPAPGGLAPRPGNRFILPLADCEFMVTKVGLFLSVDLATHLFQTD